MTKFLVFSALFLLLFSLALPSSGFSFSCITPKSCTNFDTSLAAVSTSLSRGQFLSSTAAMTAALVGAPESSLAAAAPASKATSVLVLGASGRTGMSVVTECLRREIKVISATRSGSDPFKVIKLDKTNYTPFPEGVDVKDAESVRRAIEAVNPSAVVFCASASKKGGNAEQVDFLGPKNVASVVGGRKLVLVSALAVTRPESQGYKMTNSMGGVVDGIMSYKLQGEDAVRKTTKNYAIIRPGVLVSGKGGGPIEVAQGDYQGGGLSREELASLVVDAVVSPQSRFTVEVYRQKTRTALQKEFEGKGTFLAADATKDPFAGVKMD